MRAHKGEASSEMGRVREVAECCQPRRHPFKGCGSSRMQIAHLAPWGQIPGLGFPDDFT